MFSILADTSEVGQGLQGDAEQEESHNGALNSSQFSADEPGTDDYLWGLSDVGRSLILRHDSASGASGRYAVAPYDVRTFLDTSPLEGAARGPGAGLLHPGAGLPRPAPAVPKHVAAPASEPLAAPVPRPRKPGPVPAERQGPQFQPFSFSDREQRKTRMTERAEADAAAKMAALENELNTVFHAKEWTREKFEAQVCTSRNPFT
jgi:hypothetical protein